MSISNRAEKIPGVFIADSISDRPRTSCFAPEDLNISSMRSVTTYPPTALPAASSTPTKPMIFSSGVVAPPSATIAPTSTMPCTKLDPDISGVCRITGTLAMIS